MTNKGQHATRLWVFFIGLLLLATTVPAAGQDYPGFSLDPPSGDDWRLVQQNAKSLVWMKRVDMEDSTFLVAVLTGPAPVSFDSPEAFLAFVKKSKQTNPDPSRFVVHRSKVAAVTHPGSYCASYDTAIEDRSSAQGEARPLLLEVAGLACLHPDAANRYFDVQYSSRHRIDTETRASEASDGREFVNGFRFADPPPDGKWALGKRPLETPAKEST
ncbi:MAG: hypothetical protein ACR2QU_04780 [Gammaproteobacteria bacterium]